jgi:hypothetical protein
LNWPQMSIYFAICNCLYLHLSYLPCSNKGKHWRPFFILALVNFRASPCSTLGCNTPPPPNPLPPHLQLYVFFILFYIYIKFKITCWVYNVFSIRKCAYM